MRYTIFAVVVALTGCGATQNVRLVSYAELVERTTIGHPISQVAATLGTPSRTTEVGDETHYTYLDGTITPVTAQTSGSTTGTGTTVGTISNYGAHTASTTTYQGGDFVGCILTLRVNRQTNVVVGVLTEAHQTRYGTGGCPGRWEPVTAQESAAGVDQCRNACYPIVGQSGLDCLNTCDRL